MIARNLLRRLQRIQDRLGAGEDGMVSPVTISRMEDQLGMTPPAADVSLTVSKSGLDQIVQFEVSSESYYNRRLARPSWPGASSGATIGIGYDLGYHSKSQITRDWSRFYADDIVQQLADVSGIRGEAGKPAAQRLKDAGVRILFDDAREVFYSSTVPRFAATVRRTYPGAQNLPADAQAMLLSLIYNRGPSLSGSRRREMAAIKPLVPGRDFAGIADQIRSMERLWEGRGLEGLITRRETEARLVQSSDHRYDPSELVPV